ncbi:MAG: hypothetical protein ABIO63_08945 [Casimicrobiaceae bacterium]
MDNTYGLTIEQAKELKRGVILNHSLGKNADGSPAKYKVTSVKTWKRIPYKIEINVKHGLREYYCFNQYLLEYLRVEPVISQFQNEEELDEADKQEVRVG